MTGPSPLNRSTPGARAAAPVRIVHLGLGNFFRAHAARYTDQAPDAAQWGIAAFGSRSDELAATLAAQAGLYTLVTRGPVEDRFDLVASISRAYGGTDEPSWRECFRSPDLACVTLTVTEFGYRDGLAAARLVTGLAERRRVGAGPLAVMSCDNLPGNGEVTRRVVLAAPAPPNRPEPKRGLRDWIEGHATFPDHGRPDHSPSDTRTGIARRGRDRPARPGARRHRTVQRMGGRGGVPGRAAELGTGRGDHDDRHRAARATQVAAAQREPTHCWPTSVSTAA